MLLHASSSTTSTCYSCHRRQWCLCPISPALIAGHHACSCWGLLLLQPRWLLLLLLLLLGWLLLLLLLLRWLLLLCRAWWQ